MSEESLVAPVDSSREVWTGSSLADSIEDLVDRIRAASPTTARNRPSSTARSTRTRASPAR